MSSAYDAISKPASGPSPYDAISVSAGAPGKEPPPVNTWTDIAKSAITGLAQGAAGIGDQVAKLAVMLTPSVAAATLRNPAVGQAVMNGGSINDTISQPIPGINPQGGYYEPKTIPGHYAQSVGQYAPAAALPGGVASRVGRVVLSGVGAEAGGELADRVGLPALRPYAQMVGAAAGGVAAEPVIRSINAGTSRIGLPIQNPRTAAQDMLAAAVERDGGKPALQENLDGWRGNSAPALVDVTGNNVRRLVRSAASGGAGEAQNVATTYADRVAGNLQDNATALARGLTPVTNSAGNYGNLLEDLQKSDAEFNYKQPYSEPAAVTPDMVDALQGPEGRGAISRAYAAARANRNGQQMAELKDLQDAATAQSGGADPITGQFRSLENALKNVSAGTLDRVRISMRETGRALSAKGANDIAGGYFGRVKDIDTALDQTEGLKAARASYRNYAAQGEALDLGRTGLNAAPDDYVSQLRQFSAASPETAAAPGAKTAAGVGYRQAITDAIGRPAEGATGLLNRLATSTNQTRNLASTYGEQAASDFQKGVGDEIGRVRNSRFISPNSGSQTALRLEDAGLLDIPVSKVGILGAIYDKVKAAMQLTPEERAELVRMGTTEAKLVNVSRVNPTMTGRALTSAVLSGKSDN